MEKLDRQKLYLTYPFPVLSWSGIGFDVLKIKDLAMAFDKPLFEHVSFEVKKEERVLYLGLTELERQQFVPSDSQRLYAFIWENQNWRQGHDRLLWSGTDVADT